MRARRGDPGFSLIELVIVVVILGVVAAIAAPRLGGAAERAQTANLNANLARLQKAIDLYTAEHGDQCPASNGAGGFRTNGRWVVERLEQRTDSDGTINNGSGLFGPYLRAFPVNPINNLATVRIDGAAAGANTHGWRYDTATRSIAPDHGPGAVGGQQVDAKMGQQPVDLGAN